MTETEAFFDFFKELQQGQKDLFSDAEQYQVYNFYRHPDRARGEKVLRTFGTKEHCEAYARKYASESGTVWLSIEPYNADEWQNPKANECCILPLEKFEDEK